MIIFFSSLKSFQILSPPTNTTLALSQKNKTSVQQPPLKKPKKRKEKQIHKCKQNKIKTVQSITCWSTTHEHEACPRGVDMLSVSVLDKPDFPSPRMYRDCSVLTH